MELYLQFGWGMMEHSRQLIQDWGGGTVILSPRDLRPDQLAPYSQSIHKIGGRILLDPQFYLPHADHERLRSHVYWPADYESIAFWTGEGIKRLLSRLFNLNRSLNCDEIILPGMHADQINDDWLGRQSAIIDLGRQASNDSDQLIATIALGEDVVRDADQVHDLLTAAEKWNITSYYLICEHPDGEYLVRDPNWLANVVDLIAGLRLKHNKVILGYSQHQMLIAAAAAVNVVASGTWMNVRSFPPEKFRLQYDDEFKPPPSIWYYSPQALSEFTLPFLDLAQRQNVLDLIAVSDSHVGKYASTLFSGKRPSAVGFRQQSAFRHYLQCLRDQCIAASRATFEESADHHARLLESASNILERLHSAGVKGQLRDFGSIVEINDAALQVLKSDRGLMLRRAWARL